jgi:hypothetical protein
VATPFDAQPRILLRSGNSERVIEVEPQASNAHLPLITSFARRTIAGEPLEFDGLDGMQASRIMSAAYRSGESGRWEPA